MSKSTRLKKLEEAIPSQRAAAYNFSDSEWAEVFQNWGDLGHFDMEPGFPSALTAYRKALADAEADPQFQCPHVNDRLLCLLNIAERCAPQPVDEGLPP